MFSFGEKTMVRFKAIPLCLVFGLSLSLPAFASNFCVAVNKGFNHGGTTYVGPSFALPGSGNCRSWAGFTKTGTNVIASATGTGCVSSDGKVFTLSVADIDPQFFGAGVIGVDYIQICPNGVTGCPISGNDQGNFNGTAAEQTCSASLLKLPDAHN
jgi:hypothetical protein